MTQDYQYACPKGFFRQKNVYNQEGDAQCIAPADGESADGTTTQTCDTAASTSCAALDASAGSDNILVSKASCFFPRQSPLALTLDGVTLKAGADVATDPAAMDTPQPKQPCMAGVANSIVPESTIGIRPLPGILKPWNSLRGIQNSWKSRILES